MKKESKKKVGKKKVVKKDDPKVCNFNSSILKESQQFQQFLMQLYEKGLLSGETVLKLSGFDPNQEIDRKKSDSIQCNTKGSLNSSREYSDIEIKQIRIEQARRNVEALGKIMNSLTEKDSVMSDIKANIKIMNEVSKL